MRHIGEVEFLNETVAWGVLENAFIFQIHGSTSPPSASATPTMDNRNLIKLMSELPKNSLTQSTVSSKPSDGDDSSYTDEEESQKYDDWIHDDSFSRDCEMKLITELEIAFSRSVQASHSLEESTLTPEVDSRTMNSSRQPSCFHSFSKDSPEQLPPIPRNPDNRRRPSSVTPGTSRTPERTSETTLDATCIARTPERKPRAGLGDRRAKALSLSPPQTPERMQRRAFFDRTPKPPSSPQAPERKPRAGLGDRRAKALSLSPPQTPERMQRRAFFDRTPKPPSSPQAPERKVKTAFGEGGADLLPLSIPQAPERHSRPLLGTPPPSPPRTPESKNRFTIADGISSVPPNPANMGVRGVLKRNESPKQEKKNTQQAATSVDTNASASIRPRLDNEELIKQLLNEEQDRQEQMDQNLSEIMRLVDELKMEHLLEDEQDQLKLSQCTLWEVVQLIKDMMNLGQLRATTRESECMTKRQESVYSRLHQSDCFSLLRDIGSRINHVFADISKDFGGRGLSCFEYGSEFLFKCGEVDPSELKEPTDDSPTPIERNNSLSESARTDSETDDYQQGILDNLPKRTEVSDDQKCLIDNESASEEGSDKDDLHPRTASGHVKHRSLTDSPIAGVLMGVDSLRRPRGDSEDSRRRGGEMIQAKYGRFSPIAGILMGDAKGSYSNMPAQQQAPGEDAKCTVRNTKMTRDSLVEPFLLGGEHFFGAESWSTPDAAYMDSHEELDPSVPNITTRESMIDSSKVLGSYVQSTANEDASVNLSTESEDRSRKVSLLEEDDEILVETVVTSMSVRTENIDSTKPDDDNANQDHANKNKNWLSLDQQQATWLAKKKELLARPVTPTHRISRSPSTTPQSQRSRQYQSAKTSDVSPRSAARFPGRSVVWVSCPDPLPTQKALARWYEAASAFVNEVLQSAEQCRQASRRVILATSCDATTTAFTTAPQAQGPQTIQARGPPSTQARGPPSTQAKSPPSMQAESPPSTQAKSPPATQAESPPATQAKTPPATQAESPPATQVESPPATQAESPPATQAESPPATQAKTPPATQAKTPPATQAKTPPSTQAKTPPSTQTKGPPSTQAKGPPSTQAKSPPSMQAESPPSTQAESPPATQVESPPATQAKSPPATQAKSPPAAQAKNPPSTQAKSPPATQARTPLATQARTPPATPTPPQALELDERCRSCGNNEICGTDGNNEICGTDDDNDSKDKAKGKGSCVQVSSK